MVTGAAPARSTGGIDPGSLDPLAVVVTGLGTTNPLGGDLAATWRALRAGRCAVRLLDEPWAEEYRLAVRVAAPLARDASRTLTPRERRRLDRASQCALLAAREAWAHAGSPEVDGQRLSVSVSPGMGLVRSVIDTWETLRGRGPRRVLPTAVPALMPNAPAAAVGIELGARGGIHAPVSACASGAEAISYGADLIALGRADVVVAGAIDDISIESVVGFGNMNATAEAAAMRAKGISDRHFSRANDRRRGGFVEAEGGGTVILARGSVAARMGLPVAGVVGFVSSYADGAHTSIPAPGLGALGAGRGGRSSRLAKALAALGVEADDIALVSKHDTSTGANDPNESELHTRLARALGRSEGNSLVAVSQKTITGHAKGGAAVFQVAGLTEILASGVAPGNASLDVVDAPLAKDAFWVWPRRPIRLAGRGGQDGRVPGAGPVRAGLLTSLGFGHVSGLIAIVHPGAFEAALRQAEGQEAVDAWLASANARLAAGTRRRRAGMIGRAPLFEQVQGRRLGEESKQRDPHEVEAAMLLDPEARLGSDGVYHAGE